MFMDLMPHAKLVTVEGASHFLQETHADILCKNIVKFLQGSSKWEEYFKLLFAKRMNKMKLIFIYKFLLTSYKRD